MSNIKEIFDSRYLKIDFNKNLSNKIKDVNNKFIMKNNDTTYFLSGVLIGCYNVNYNYTDEDYYFNTIFNTNSKEARELISSCKDINKKFVISSDIVNNHIFYTVHRFLTNNSLKKDEKLQYSLLALNYFTYRTLCVISSMYFSYPISENEAQAVYEKLNNKYIIKNVKNWLEYSEYRSRAFLDSKFLEVLEKFNDHEKIAAAINDLFNRTKDTIKNIYKEFIYIHEMNQTIGSSKKIITSPDDIDTIADKLHGPELYYQYLQTTLTDKNTFIKNELVQLIPKLIKGTTQQSIENLLNLFFNYYIKNKDNYDRVNSYIHNVLIITIEYLFKNKYIVKHNNDLIYIINKIIGQLLYARGDNLHITNVKNEGIEIIKILYDNKSMSDRYLSSLSNSLFIYIILRAFTKNYYS